MAKSNFVLKIEMFDEHGSLRIEKISEINICSSNDKGHIILLKSGASVQPPIGPDRHAPPIESDSKT